jgi:transcriptional regulator with XRE-family HTH domain
MLRRTGMSREALSRLENHRSPNPTVRTLARYAAAVGLELRLAAKRPRSG